MASEEIRQDINTKPGQVEEKPEKGPIYTKIFKHYSLNAFFEYII